MIRRKRITREDFAFLPNMVTLFNLFTGFMALLMAAHGNLVVACWLILLSLVWDSLDGNIARMFKNPSLLGKELDSLADLVSFVVTPAFITAIMLLRHFSPWSLLILFGYLGCGTYRLARFNVQPSSKNSFEGLPTPAAAMTISMTILAAIKNEWVSYQFFGQLCFLLIMILSFLMVSKIRYPKFSAMPFDKWQSFFYAAAAIFTGGLILRHLETSLAFNLFIFVFVSPVYSMHALMVPSASDAE